MGIFSVFSIRFKTTWRILISLIVILFIYCEYITYWKLHMTWMEQPSCAAPHCKKLLLVSDPQIIGPEWKPFFPVDLVAIWDSDRYLRRTFLSAVEYLKPDIVVFLGDLMDQGHTASDNEFETYVQRLEKVFELPNSLKGTKIIISPGDNDVGGIEDVLLPDHVERFDKRFNQTEECTLINFIEFCKVNLMTSVMQHSRFINGRVRVVLSHVPLTPKQSYFLKEVVKKIRPSVIFSGHLHTSSHYTAYEDDVWSYKHSSINPSESKPKIYKFHEGLIHEIIVPTCSYRMGVPEMGYGAAFIDNQKQLVQYNVLWLPHRFRQMFIYSMTILPLVLFLATTALRRIRRNRYQAHSRISKAYSSMP